MEASTTTKTFVPKMIGLVPATTVVYILLGLSAFLPLLFFAILCPVLRRSNKNKALGPIPGVHEPYCFEGGRLDNSRQKHGHKNQVTFSSVLDEESRRSSLSRSAYDFVANTPDQQIYQTHMPRKINMTNASIQVGNNTEQIVEVHVNPSASSTPNSQIPAHPIDIEKFIIKPAKQLNPKLSFQSVSSASSSSSSGQSSISSSAVSATPLPSKSQKASSSTPANKALLTAHNAFSAAPANKTSLHSADHKESITSEDSNVSLPFTKPRIISNSPSAKVNNSSVMPVTGASQVLLPKNKVSKSAAQKKGIVNEAMEEDDNNNELHKYGENKIYKLHVKPKRLTKEEEKALSYFDEICEEPSSRLKEHNMSNDEKELNVWNPKTISVKKIGAPSVLITRL